MDNIDDLLSSLLLTNDTHDTSQKQIQMNQPSQDPIINKVERDPVQTLREYGIQKQIKNWLKSWPTKKLFAVTELTGCILQTYLKLAGLVRQEDINIQKLFYLLDIYGRMGDVVHQYIYNVYRFKQTEVTYEDPQNHIRGRIDGLNYNDDVWELKSGKVYGTEIKQVALQYHLMKVNDIHPKRFRVWWVLQQKIAIYQPEDLEPLVPELVGKANRLYDSLQNRQAPTDLIDSSQCKWCPIKSTCDRIREQTKVM